MGNWAKGQGMDGERLRVRSEFSLPSNSTVSLTNTGFTSFQCFLTPASSISGGYEPYNSTQVVTEEATPSAVRTQAVGYLLGYSQTGLN